MDWILSLATAVLFVVLWRLFSALPRAPVRKIHGDGMFAVEVVGKSHYRDVLGRLFPPGSAGDNEEVGVFASLRLEDSNPHDAQAVGVYIYDQKVGYLSRARAHEFRASIKRDGLLKWSEFLVDAQVWVPREVGISHSVSLDLPQA